MVVASCRIKATSNSAQRFSIIDQVMNKFLSILEDPFDVALPIVSSFHWIFPHDFPMILIFQSLNVYCLWNEKKFFVIVLVVRVESQRDLGRAIGQAVA